MNEARRKELSKAIGLIQEIGPKLDEAKSIIESCATEERDYYDNMHENLQQGDKGSQADNAATQLEEVQSTLEEFDIDEMVGKIEEAKQ